MNFATFSNECNLTETEELLASPAYDWIYNNAGTSYPKHYMRRRLKEEIKCNLGPIAGMLLFWVIQSLITKLIEYWIKKNLSDASNAQSFRSM